MTDSIDPGLYEAVVTERLQALLATLPDDDLADLAELIDAEAADRLSRHLSALVRRAIASEGEKERATTGVRIARDLVLRLNELTQGRVELAPDAPVEPGRLLHEVMRKRPDGRPHRVRRPLTPLLDTTVLTNAPGEPALRHELQAEIESADEIDVLMAFIRWSGVRSVIDDLHRHCDAGKPLRVITTTYTNSTEQKALDKLQAAGADICVSYDTSSTRLHAKAWIFHRTSGYSTAYLGSSNLTYSAQVPGLEWNVRLAEARNEDAISKMRAMFATYWESRDFEPYDPMEFAARTATPTSAAAPLLLSPIEVVLKPFQEELLERLALARHQGHRRNLLVSATGTGKTVMAAVDYARLRSSMKRARLLFVAHRVEILNQTTATFRHALRDPAFGETWVGGARPSGFENVFASIQSLSASEANSLDPEHFDVVIVDEFHHAAAPTYDALLARLRPKQLLGLTATPERADGLDVLAHFDGRIAAELRLWEAIDQQYLAPFDYFGVSDEADLREVPWKRGRGYDIGALTGLLTADNAWANKVIHEVGEAVSDPRSMRCVAFCVSIDHARFMADRFRDAGLAATAVWATTAAQERHRALQDLEAGRLNVLCAVDLFNEGVDLPSVDTLLLLRPTDSGTLFLQQLGRGLRKLPNKSVCTVLDFVGLHRKEFRFDRKLRALLGGSRKELENQVVAGFPFLPAGCSFTLDPVARQRVLDNIRQAIPGTWRDRCAELRLLGDVGLSTYLEETGLEIDDVYANGRSWSAMRREVGLPTESAGPSELPLQRAVGRLLHVDDTERISTYQALIELPNPPTLSELSPRMQGFVRMLVACLTTHNTSDPLEAGIDEIWAHPQIRHELHELLTLMHANVSHVPKLSSLPPEIPLQVHARYTRLEIFGAFGIGGGAAPPTWQTGVWWDDRSQTDLFAFTLDKSVGGFSPTTRYRDYAISPTRVHWESQAATSVASPAGQRYIHHLERRTRIMLFARLRATERAFWCLGPARYHGHEGDRPIAFVWELEIPLPADLYTAMAAAVA